MVAGTTVAGTESAGDLVFDDAEFATCLRKADAREGLRGFDILLHARNLPGRALRAEVIGFRVSSEILSGRS